MSSLQLSSFEDKCVGVLIGAMTGDTLGAPLEFKTSEIILEKQKLAGSQLPVTNFINKKTWQDDLDQYYYTG